VRERALALFAGKAQRAIGLRGDVVIFITTSRQMRDMNRLYRKKNEPTDVLSFPSQNPKLIGDIAISAEIAARNGAQLGHSTETELRILILHGLLHLAGYDHEVDDGEMRAYESRLRQQFDLPTGLIERAHASTPSQRRARVPVAPAGARTKHAPQPLEGVSKHRVKAKSSRQKRGGGQRS
jgi:probable rRNA maturation factor